MSDGKSSSYQVVSAAELERRALAAASDRLARARERANAAHAALQAAEVVYGSLGVRATPAPAATAGSSAGVDAEAAALEARTADLQSRTEAAVVTARSSRLLASVADVFSAMLPAAAPAPLGGAPAAAPDAPVEQPAPDVLRDWGAEAQRVLTLLPADARSDETERCRTLLAELGAAADDGRRTTVVAALRSTVQTARARAVLEATNREQLDALHTALDGLEGHEVEAMRGHLRALPLDRTLPGDLAPAVAACADRARRAADRAFVLAAARDALTASGYEVGDGFVTIASTPEGALMPLLTSDRHGVRVRERNGQLLFNIVRFDETGALNRTQDLAAAETFCAGYGRVISAIADRGVDVQPLVHYEPGAGGVQVTTTASPFARARLMTAVDDRGEVERERNR